jgi:aspartyl-tRNA synthetase
VLGGASLESVVSVLGTVSAGENGWAVVEVQDAIVHAPAAPTPFPVAPGGPEPDIDLRFRHRHLDLRRPRAARVLVLRAALLAAVRELMTRGGFLEVQTPLLTVGCPEGARDYLVPSRRFPGSFYALPQSAQQFKQILMASGIERYYQIAPCFRDEDSNKRRSPGEFYQWDFEMAFTSEDEVLAFIESAVDELFGRFGSDWPRSAPPFVRITYGDAIRHFGTDKPDLRNPLEFALVTDLLAGHPTPLAVEAGVHVLALRLPGGSPLPPDFAGELLQRVQSAGVSASMVVPSDGAGLPSRVCAALRDRARAAADEAVLLMADDLPAWQATRPSGLIRDWVGERLGLVRPEAYAFCWVTDNPTFERDAQGAIRFRHNPFSMVRGGLDALREENPMDLVSVQYDLVCNGVELSSGAIRAHDAEVLLRKFAIVGIERAEAERQFAGVLGAFRHGVPPHGGAALGIERLMLLLAREADIREVIAFPMGPDGRDPVMHTPSPIAEARLRELHLRLSSTSS